MAATEMSSKAIAAKIRSAPSVRRRRRHRGAIVALVVIVALLAGSGVAAAIAYNVVKTQANQLQAQLTIHLESAQSELEAAKASLKSANSSHDEAFVSQASVHFTTAKLQFAVARQMADSSRLLKQIEQLPEVGGLATSRQAAVDNISDMGIAISDAGLELASLEGQLIKPPGAGGQEGRTLLTVLNQASSSLVIVRKDLGLAQTAAAKVDLQILPAAQQASFVKARGTIGSAIASADEFARLVPIMNELLGGNGARTYLIEQVNPAELRPGGGFIGTYSVLQANQGSLTLVRSGNATDLIGTRAAPGGRGYVTPPGPLREFIPNTSWSFIDSNFFPDFASNASAGEMFAQPYLSSHIDGVIAFDYYAVAKMLELTGPLPVPGYRITLTSTNFVPLVVQSDILAPDPSHKAMLAAVAGISLLVGGIGVTNIMLVTVTERTREIGIRKALGATRGAILGQFLTEATLLSLLGGALGVLGAVVGSRFQILGVTPMIVGSSVVLALGVSIGIGVFFGGYPAFRAARMRPVDALRHE